MKNKAKTTNQMERERGPKSKQVQKQKQKAAAVFRTAASTSNKHIFQNTCSNGFIQNFGESSKSLFLGKTSCSLKLLAVGMSGPDKDKHLSVTIRLHLF